MRDATSPAAFTTPHYLMEQALCGHLPVGFGHTATTIRDATVGQAVHDAFWTADVPLGVTTTHTRLPGRQPTTSERPADRTATPHWTFQTIQLRVGFCWRR